MTGGELEIVESELRATYPSANVVVSESRQEVIAEIKAGFAVAVIERSAPHFHAKSREIYRVIRGALMVVRGGFGHILIEGDSLAIEPGEVHFATCQGAAPTWVEVTSTPPWSPGDHFLV